MTQNEQKPESAEFRTLETQVSECACDLRASLIALDEKLYSEFVEAEFRGAAWQRQFDAEDNEIVRWQAFECGRGWFDITEDKLPLYGESVRPLYTRPANVAALEARVKELEGVLTAKDREIAQAVAADRERNAMFCDELGKGFVENRRADDYERAFMEGGANALEMLSRALRVDFDLAKFKAAAIREGGEHG